MKGSRKAQAAVELIMIMVIILFVFSYVFQYSLRSEQLTDSQLRLAKAEKAAQDIVQAAEMISSEGMGSRARVFVEIPEGSELVFSEGAVNILVNIRGEITDVPVGSIAEMCGSIPSRSGGYWLTLEVQEGCVNIQREALNVIPASMSFNLYKGNYSNESVIVFNYGEDTIDINLTIDRGDLPVDVDLSTNVSNITGLGEDSNVKFMIGVVAGDTTGTYSATVRATALDGEEIIDLSEVSTKVAISSLYEEENIIIFPGSWNFGDAVGGEEASKQFSICNNMVTEEVVNASLDSEYLSFQDDAYLNFTQYTIAAESCNSTTVYLNSTGAPLGNYAQYLSATNGDSDSVLIEFEVE